jgi:hypothetical protein
MTDDCPLTICAYGPSPDAPAHMRYAACTVARLVPAKGAIPARMEPGTALFATGPTPEAARAVITDAWRRHNPKAAKRAKPTLVEDLV